MSLFTFISTISIHVIHRLSQLEKLQVLDLSVNSLREVPESVYSLSQLTELNLALCGLSYISDRYVNDVNSIVFHITCMCIICIAKMTKHNSLILATPFPLNPYIIFYIFLK